MSVSQVSNSDVDVFDLPSDSDRKMLLKRVAIVVGITVLVVVLAYWRTGGSGLLVTQAIVTGLLVGGSKGIYSSRIDGWDQPEVVDCEHATTRIIYYPGNRWGRSPAKERQLWPDERRGQSTGSLGFTAYR